MTIQNVLKHREFANHIALVICFWHVLAASRGTFYARSFMSMLSRHFTVEFCLSSHTLHYSWPFKGAPCSSEGYKFESS